MFFTYVIQSLSLGTFYTGHTQDLETRLFQHNNGLLGKYTKGKGPWKLVYFESFETRSEAVKREKYFKTGAGRDFIKQAIQK